MLESLHRISPVSWLGWSHPDLISPLAGIDRDMALTTLGCVPVKYPIPWVSTI
jgi:hypothetical protein